VDNGGKLDHFIEESWDNIEILLKIIDDCGRIWENQKEPFPPINFCSKRGSKS
jgi:hypothetical protein